MDASPVMTLAVMATTTLIAATSPSNSMSPSPSSNLHLLHYHGAPPPGSGQDPDGDDNGECKLFGPFSLIIQAALGALALLSLVYKRWRERPQRPVKVWAFDVSKQVFGSAMLHLANLLMSMFSAGQLEIRQQYKPNPCSFYLLNLGIDVSCYTPDSFVTLTSETHYQICADNSWYPHSYPHPPRPELLCLLLPSRQSSRID